MKAYKVALAHPMYEDGVFYTNDIGIARQELADRLWKYRHDDRLDKEDGKPFTFDRKSILYPHRLLTIRFGMWERCSYEYDEWDTEPFELVLDEIEIVERGDDE